ncbi:MAG: helix-turn-helix transcriptional regulator [Pseudomonadales bacterium]|nr:helix-turn-helix transcriptional regulator [Pseudomonadales bacterium]
MTLQQLADKVGTSASALHRYEAGWDRFEVATLRRIATALGAQLEVRLLAPEPPMLEKPDARSLVRQIGPLFWDKRLTVEDLASHPEWVLTRVLMFGNGDQARAARSFFGNDPIRDAIGRRGVDPRTRAYWKLLLGDDGASSSTH